MEGVRELRESMGLSQEELAARAGVNRLTISRIEAGKNTPRGSPLRKLAVSSGRSSGSCEEANGNGLLAQRGVQRDEFRGL
jgi:transcriptional regulator with XRE-family HTH domain